MPKRQFFTEETLADALQKTVIPYLTQRRTAWNHTCADGTVLFCLRYDADAPRGSVVLLHGLGECTEKFLELCYYFLKDGLTVLIFDQRGHGRSTRKCERKTIYVRRFSQYVSDLAEVLCDQEEHLPAPHYLFAHSMGGAVSALYLERHPAFFEKALLSSPMIAVKYRGIPRPLVRWMCAGAALLGAGKRRPFLLHPAREPQEEAFAYASGTSEARFDAYQQIKIAEPLYRNAKPSYSWTREALACTGQILARGAPERIRAEVLLLAAEQEHLVERAEQEQFIARVPHGTLVTVKDAKHELYYAHDAVLHPYLDTVLDFFS